MTTIVLGGVTLNPNMVWVDRFITQKAVQTARRTLGGRPVVYAGSVSAGFNITLEATPDYGWLQKVVTDQLLVMADVPGAIYTLTFNAIDYSVIFRHHDAPALDLAPLIPRVPHEDTDYFIGQIKLMTV